MSAILATARRTSTAHPSIVSTATRRTTRPLARSSTTTSISAVVSTACRVVGTMRVASTVTSSGRCQRT